jgi:TusA-related sulfurtransferase
MAEDRVIDVRGLEPPQPLENVLEEAARLEAGQRLRVIHTREPCLLYPLLAKRGFEHETLVNGDELFEFLVWRKNRE